MPNEDGLDKTINNNKTWRTQAAQQGNKKIKKM
jgi:hypothetical protein